MYNGHTEILTINGNEMLDEKYTMMGDRADKIRVSATQYKDRIEFSETPGVTA